MFKTIQTTWPKDADLPSRAYDLTMLSRVLDGTMYDNLKYAFHQELDAQEKYIPLRDRRPSVRYRMCGLVVDDVASLLFSDGHFPDVQCKEVTDKESIEALIKELSLNELFILATTRGSVGSVAILLRVLEHRPFLSVMDTPYLTPVWKKAAPDTLEKVVEQYKVKGKDLNSIGYSVKEENADYWFQRDWTELQEIWYNPLLDSDKKKKKQPTVDESRTVSHALGFVPIIWIKNLPGGDDIDGACTFPSEAIDTNIEIDYQLSQAGRGLKYTSDPTLLIKEPAGEGGNLVKGAGNAIVVGPEGDAKMLEINGTAAEAVMEYVRLLREFAVESMHGNRASAEKMSAAQSGRALEIMNQALIWLADKLRISYGEGGLLNLLNMLIKAHAKIPFKLKNGDDLPAINPKTAISLRWPAWYAPTLQDMLNRAITLVKLCDGGLLSRQTAIMILSIEYDIEDAAAEKLLADADMKERNEAAQVKVAINEQEPETQKDTLPYDLHIGNLAVAVAHRMRVKGVVIIAQNQDDTISFCGHGLTHAKANELLSVGIHINLTQHDDHVRKGTAGAEAREMQEEIDARNEVTA